MLQPGDLVTLSADDYAGGSGGIMAGVSRDPPDGIWIEMPFVVLSVFEVDTSVLGMYEIDHNVMLFGSNGVIGWLPETWVKKC